MKALKLSALVILTSLGFAGSALAQSTWDAGGGSNTSWSDGANWVGGSAPGSGTALIFQGTDGISYTSTHDSTATFVVSGMSITSGAFSIGGQKVTLKTGITDSDGSDAESVSFSGSSSYSSAEAMSVTAGGNLTLGGTWQGSENFTKSGTGMLIISGSQNYVGTATIGSNAGSLLFGTGGSMNSSTGVTVANDTFGTVNTNVASTTLLANAPTLSLALGITGTQSNLALNLYATSSDEINTSALTLTGSGALLVTLTDLSGDQLSSTPYLLMTNTGALTTSEVTLAGSALGEGSLSVMNNDLLFTASAVPEPSTWALLLGGVGVLIALQKRRLGSV